LRTEILETTGEVANRAAQAIAARAARFRIAEGWGQWNRWIDTALQPPEDIVTFEETRPVPGGSYRAAPHSVVVLFSSIPDRQSYRPPALS
jgi:hypothetical protein